MATRTYTAGGRNFDLALSASPSGGLSWAWTVERVFEDGQELDLPGIESVVASDEDTAYRRACARIDKWLLGSA